jgi:hypothetical protein
MPNAQDQMESLHIAVPCQASWEGMAGDERVRHCTLCSLNVYNFAEMTRDEVRELLVRTEGRVCARLYRRADGTVLTRDCPVGLRALRRRASRVAAALFAALVSLPALAFGDTTGTKPRFKAHGAKVKLEIERVANPQAAVLSGVVLLQDGVPLPGVTITVLDEVTKREVTAVTDGNGAFSIVSLNDGVYRVDVTLAGLKPARIDHLELRGSEVAHASVTLRLENLGTITVGALADPIRMDNGISTTFSKDFMEKIPF